jgi:hypothetical protein
MSWLLKMLGVVLLAIGFWILKNFPDVMQRSEVTKTGLFVGGAIFITGLALLILG